MILKKRISSIFMIAVTIALLLLTIAGFKGEISYGAGMGPSFIDFAPREGNVVWPTAAPVPDLFLTVPEKSTYEERRVEYLKWVSERDVSSLLGGVVGVRTGAATGIKDAAVEEAAVRLDERKDCADFTMIRVLWVLYEHKSKPFLTNSQYERLKKSVLNFKYWVDEPGEDAMISWTENHQILFHSSEYLAGTLFPGEIFPNNGKDGKWHAEHARPLIGKWIERRAKWGFSEWDSNVYYAEDLAGILALAGFAEDAEISTRAQMAVDLMLFDVGSDLFRGIYGTSHGRSYTAQITSPRRDSLNTVIRLVWGLSYYRGSDMDSVFIALNPRYRPPEAIIKAGREIREEVTNRERQGIPITEAPKYGLAYKNPGDIVFFWGMGAYTQREVLVTSLKAFDKWNLWNQPFLEEAAEYVKKLPKSSAVLSMIGDKMIEPDRTLLGQVNKVTFRTPDYQLSSAVDYRPGGLGSQQFIWQASLSPDAVVYTSTPGSPVADGDRTPTYWTGNNRLPRVGQYKNILLAIYKNEPYTVLAERYFFNYTHAFFPFWAFDETSESGNWTFGRKGGAYIALYSSSAPFRTKEGRDAGVEIVAPGRETVWLCRMGRKAADGSFEDFKSSVVKSPLRVENLKVTFTDPAAGLVEFGWTGPLTVNGAEVPLSNYKHFDNPYSQSDFDQDKFQIESGGSRLKLDFSVPERIVEN